MCSAKSFGLLLCVTIFWRQRWPRSYPYHRSFPSNRPAVWVLDRTDGKHDYNITLMPVGLLLTIANELCYFTCRANCSRHLCYLIRHWDHLYAGAYCAEHALLSSEELTTFTRLIKCQTNQLLNTSHDYAGLGEHGDFDKYSLDEAIKDQLIEHRHSTTLRRCLLHEKSTASLSSLLDIARSMESANFQAANIENASSPGTLRKRALTDNANYQRRTSEFYFREAATMYTLW